MHTFVTWQNSPSLPTRMSILYKMDIQHPSHDCHAGRWQAGTHRQICRCILRCVHGQPMSVQIWKSGLDPT